MQVSAEQLGLRSGGAAVRTINATDFLGAFRILISLNGAKLDYQSCKLHTRTLRDAGVAYTVYLMWEY